MNRYEEAAQMLNDMAKVKMAMNSHKGNIEDGNSKHIMELMQGELNELYEAVSKGDLMHVIEEAADVQNFLLAIVYQQITKYRSRK